MSKLGPLQVPNFDQNDVQNYGSQAEFLGFRLPFFSISSWAEFSAVSRGKFVPGMGPLKPKPPFIEVRGNLTSDLLGRAQESGVVS